MDPELQRKIDEAKANGYSDEEIQQYLQSVNNPQPQQGLGPMDRSEEYTGLAQGMVADTALTAAKYGLPAAGAYFGAKKLINAAKGPVKPPESLLNATWDKALGVRQEQSMMQRGIQYADKIKQMAMEKLAQNAGTLSNVARAGAGVAAAVMPGNIGQNYPVPQSGPYRGMEINPMTNRPWTPEELAQLR